jgi:hypothetical protein
LQSFRGHRREEIIKEDFSELIFHYSKTQFACRAFLKWLRNNNCEASPAELSRFLWDLQAGKAVEGFRYQRRSFYRTILRRLMSLGFIAKEPRFFKRIVYTVVTQPLAKRPPILTTWLGFAYLVGEKWNSEFKQ